RLEPSAIRAAAKESIDMEDMVEIAGLLKVEELSRMHGSSFPKIRKQAIARLIEIERPLDPPKPEPVEPEPHPAFDAPTSEPEPSVEETEAEAEAKSDGNGTKQGMVRRGV